MAGITANNDQAREHDVGEMMVNEFIIVDLSM